MSDEKEIDKSGEQEKKNDGYEKICYLCHRPESKVDNTIRKSSFNPGIR